MANITDINPMASVTPESLLLSASPDQDEASPEAVLWGFRLEGGNFGSEYLQDYGHGGHHPVHLGDILGHQQRYRVLHKLGTGGFANVWLCRDLAVTDDTKTSP